MPGPGKKPSHLKLIAGTARIDRLQPEGAELIPVATCPPAPAWLPCAQSKAEWQRLGTILVANNLLAEESLSTFGHLCALHGRLVRIWAAGEAPNASLVTQFRALANAFGLTPVAHALLRAPGGRRARNHFDKFKQEPT